MRKRSAAEIHGGIGKKYQKRNSAEVNVPYAIFYLLPLSYIFIQVVLIIFRQ